MSTSQELTPIAALREELPTLKRLLQLNARPGVDIEALALQELEYMRNHAITKPEILQCIPGTVILAVKTVLKQNLSLDPYAGLVYIKTRSVKMQDGQWKKALEIMPSCNGLISIARQCGRILDMKRPEVIKDDAGKVTGVSVEFLLPSTPEPRWERFRFDEDDFYRWQRASHKENGRNKQDANAESLNYANENYSNWKGGIDPEFARAKAIRHALKKLGTNQNEIRMDKISTSAHKAFSVDVDATKDASAANDDGIQDIKHEEVESTIKPEPVKSAAVNSIPNAEAL